MELKKIGLLTFFLVAMVLMLGACSEKSFNATEDSVFQQCLDERPEVKCVLTCNEGGTCVEKYDYTITTEGQIKDILFVVDVSGSMHEEQAKMGSMFPNFLNILSDVDYRIAITTTDVRDVVDIDNNFNRPDYFNDFGAFQDGNLVPFDDGKKFLNGSLPLLTEQLYFERAINWEKTKECKDQNFVDYYCSNSDERGILAAAMTFEKNPSNFIRSTGHMAVVILSDEDEGAANGLLNSIAEPHREEPVQFLEHFKDLYPQKSITVHSIIVQPKNLVPRSKIENNGETQCFNDQQWDYEPDGKYGTIYAELSQLTQRAVIGDICANDANYSEQLQAIGDSVSQVREVLPCSPIGGNVEVELIPEPSYPVEIVKNLSQNEILFSEPLPQGTMVRFKFQCADDGK